MRASKHSPLLAVAVIVALLAGLPVASVTSLWKMVEKK